MTPEKTLANKLDELEAIAGIWEQKAADLKNYCRSTKAKLEGGKSPSTRKGLSKKELQELIMKRHKRLGIL